MTVGDLIKNISELIAENDKHYRSVNAQLHDSRVVLKQMKEECENEKESKEKEEGRYECFELMKKLAAMPSEKMMEYFDSDNVAEIISFLTYEYIERGINRYELEPKSKPEPKIKRGDKVDVTYYGPDDTWHKLTDCIYLGRTDMIVEIVNRNNDRMNFPIRGTKIEKSVEE